MELHVEDDGFVRAPAERAYSRLTDVGAWPSWWPGVRVAPLSRPGEAERWALELTDGSVRGRCRPLRLAIRPHGWRHDTGFLLTLTGDLVGTAELWLEPGHGGTVVHHILEAAAAAGGPAPTAAHRRYRRWLRRGLWALKDDLQAAVRADAGLTP